jgi:hypothetical protein
VLLLPPASLGMRVHQAVDCHLWHIMSSGFAQPCYIFSLTNSSQRLDSTVQDSASLKVSCNFCRDPACRERTSQVKLGQIRALLLDHEGVLFRFR